MANLEDDIQFHRNNMREIEETMIARAARATLLAYGEFLKKHNLQDIPVVRMGYFTILETYISGTPIVIGTVQAAVEDNVNKHVVEVEQDLLDEVMAGFLEAMEKVKE